MEEKTCHEVGECYYRLLGMGDGHNSDLNMGSFDKSFSFEIPRESVCPDILRLLGLSEQEIKDYYKGGVVPVTVDTRHHNANEFEFDEYEEVK